MLRVKTCRLCQHYKSAKKVSNQRKRDIGTKFEGEEEDAEWELPRASSVKWVAVPRVENVEKHFQPKEENLPIGNRKQYKKGNISEVKRSRPQNGGDWLGARKPNTSLRFGSTCTAKHSKSS